MYNVEGILRRMEVQAECLEAYAEMEGYNGVAPASVFHWQATHFRDLIQELKEALDG